MMMLLTKHNHYWVLVVGKKISNVCHLDYRACMSMQACHAFNFSFQFSGTKSLLITLAIILLIALAYAAGCVVYELKIFVDNDDSTSNTLAIQGEYVELPYYIMNTIMMYKYILQFYLPNNSGELLPHPEVDIFEIKCDKLLDEANRTEHFHRLHPSSPSPSLIPLILTRRYFDDCLPYKQKCILGEYFYQAKSPWSELNFNITINNFTDTTNVLIVAYDNYEYYLDFLLGEGHSKAVESQTMDAENYLFIFNNDQMKLSSYYFFAIQDIEGSVEWFTADRYGCHVYYNASSLTPHCTMNATNNYTCAVHGVHDNDYCFLGHVRGDEIDGMPTKSQIFNITQWVDEPLPTIEGQISVITVGGIIVGLSIVVILFIWLYYYIKTKQCCCT